MALLARAPPLSTRRPSVAGRCDVLDCRDEVHGGLPGGCGLAISAGGSGDSSGDSASSEQHLYSLDSPPDVAVRASTLHPRVAVSADVGPDLIVPWRGPSMVIVYAEHAFDPGDLELVEAQGTQGLTASRPREGSGNGC